MQQYSYYPFPSPHFSLWDEVCSKSYLFDRAKLEAAAVGAVTKTDIIDFYKRYIEHAAPDRKQLVVCIESKESQRTKMVNNNKAKADAMTVNDVKDFKEIHELFPRERRSPEQIMMHAK